MFKFVRVFFISCALLAAIPTKANDFFTTLDMSTDNSIKQLSRAFNIQFDDFVRTCLPDVSSQTISQDAIKSCQLDNFLIPQDELYELNVLNNIVDLYCISDDFVTLGQFDKFKTVGALINFINLHKKCN